MADETCTNCGEIRSKHLPGKRGGLDCPPRADGKISVVVGYDTVGMDYENHCPITRPRIEWQDPPRPPYIPMMAAHLLPKEHP